jgi:alpha-galactosidase
MTRISIQRVDTGAGEQLTLCGEHVALRLRLDGQLTLEDCRRERTWMAGGLFIEMAPATGGAQPHTYVVGRLMGLGALDDPEPFADGHGAGYRLRGTFSVPAQPLEVDLEARLYDALGCLRLGLSLRHTGREPLRLERVFPFTTGTWWGPDSLSIAGRTGGFAVYKHGWQSWSFAGGLPAGQSDPRPHLPTQVAWHHPGGRVVHGPIDGSVDVVGEEVGMLGTPGEAWAALAGFLAGEPWLGQIYFQREEGALAACALLDGSILNPGEEVALPALLLMWGSQRQLLTSYAAMVGHELGARHSEAPTGWSSWYYYFGKVSADDIRENLATLTATRTVVPVQVVQIDDGYSAAIGDWLDPNSRFPQGMAALATHIRAAGYRPGLWLAPFTAAATSQLAQEHPDWMIRDERGRPAWGGRNWGQIAYGLDTTHPAAREWLRTLFTTVTRDWGFDYLKLDFLVSAALPGKRYDPSVSRGRAVRDGLALIRETVGEDVFLLGCGCPLLAAVGLVDAMRIGPDSSPYWSTHYGDVPLPFSEGHTAPSTEGALRNTLARAWAHHALWVNDPDCLLVRDRETHLSLDEVRAFASAAALTGGMVVFSDRVGALPVDRLELAASLLPPMRECALPLDYFTSGIPPIVLAEIVRPWERWALVGLFNDAAQPRERHVTWEQLGLAPGRYHAVEFWSGAYLGRSDSGARVRLGAHGAAVLAIHQEIEVPQLISSSFHITQGAAELAAWSFDEERGEARWRIRTGRHSAGTCSIWAPSEWHPRDLESTARQFHWHRDPLGLILVTAELDGEADFTFKLEREP